MSDKFKPPLNIKQMGNIDQDANINIYIEDYVYTYLQQYVKSGNYNERLAFLIGKLIKEDNKNIILISGAVNTKYTQHNDGIINITKETWNYVYDQIEKYFNGLEVMGLMQSQPGYGSYLNEKYISQFRNNFNKLYQVYLLCDPIENLNIFYIFDKMRENLEAIKGYFIYYEKNNAMNDYMIDNKEIKANNSSSSSDEIEKQEPPEITIRKRQFDRVQKSNNDQKKIVNMLASLSAVLFLICFIMGTGLVQNEDRISKLESQLKALNNSYKELSENNKIESVFSFSDSSNANSDKNNKDNNNNSSPEKNLTPKIIKDINNNKSQEDNLSNSILDSSSSLDKNKNKNKDKDNKLLDNSLDNLIKPELESELKSNNKNKTNGQHEDKLNNKLDSAKTYVVKDGDTLSLISQKFFGNASMINKIMEINNMDDADKIYVGKVLKLP